MTEPEGPPPTKRRKFTPFNLGSHGQVKTLASLQKTIRELTANTRVLTPDEVTERIVLLKELTEKEKWLAATPPPRGFKWCAPPLGEDIHVRILKSLIVFGDRASVTAVNFDGENVAHLVLSYLKSSDEIHEVFSMLRVFEYGDLLWAKNKRGITPLHLGLMGELKEDTLQLLIDSGANLNDKDEDGDNALQYAIQWKKVDRERLDLLISLGGDWTNINNAGCNLAHEAAKWGNVSMILHLCSKGLRINPDDWERFKIEKEPLKNYYMKMVTKWSEEAAVELQNLVRLCGFGAFINKAKIRKIAEECIYDTRDSREADIRGRIETIPAFLEVDPTILNSVLTHFYKTFSPSSKSVHPTLVKFLVVDSITTWDSAWSYGNFNLLHVAASVLDAEEFDEVTHLAAQNGLQKLFSAESSANVTPLHTAMNRMELKRETIQLFMDVGVHFTQPPCSMLTHAVQQGRSKAYLEMLLTMCKVNLREMLNRQDEHFLKRTVLHFAATTGREDGKQLELLNLLLNEYQMALDLKEPFMRDLICFCCRDTALTSVNRTRSMDPSTNIEVIKALLEADKTLLDEPSGPDKETPVIMRNVHIDILLFLVEAGADLRALEKWTGFNLLHVFYSNQYQSPDIGEAFRRLVTLLAERGEYGLVCSKAVNGETPLHLAMRLGHQNLTVEVIRIFGYGGVDLGESDEMGNNRLKVIAEKKYATEEFVEMLGNTIQNFLPSPSPRQYVFQSGVDLLEYVSIGLDPTAKGKDNLTRLHVAVSNAKGDMVQLEIVRMLLNEFGFAELLSEPHLRNVIHDVVRNTGSSTPSSQGADVNTERIEIIKELLRIDGSLINEAVGPDAATPLLCFDVHLTLLKFLVDRKADLRAKLKENELGLLHSASSYLSPGDFHELVQFLIKGDNFQVIQMKSKFQLSALYTAVHYMEVEKETIQLFTAAGITLKDLDEWGNNVLMYAIIFERNVNFLKLLVEEGADFKRTNVHGNTTVHLAAENGHVEAVKHFAALGVDVNATNKSGQSALHVVLDKGVVNVHKIVEVLLEFNADKELLDNFSRSAEWYAKKRMKAEEEDKNLEETMTLVVPKNEGLEDYTCA